MILPIGEYHWSFMRQLLSLLLAFSITSCGMLRFDINGVDRDSYVASNEGGCTSDSECGEGRVCAPVKGEFPGSCARTGDGAAILGVLAIGALAIGAAAGGGGSPSYTPGPTPASYQNQDYRQDLRGCCSWHGGIDYCGAGSLYCKDGWVSGCGCN